MGCYDCGQVVGEAGSAGLGAWGQGDSHIRVFKVVEEDVDEEVKDEGAFDGSLFYPSGEVDWGCGSDVVA